MMDFTREYLVHYYEADSTRHLTLPALIQYFEDLAILHSSACGLDLSWYDRNQCGWMLLKWDVTVLSLPVFGETVRVQTRVNSMKTFQADREFTLLSLDGTVLATARTNWLLVDTVIRRPIRIQKEQFEFFGSGPGTAPLFINVGDVPAVSDPGTAARAVSGQDKDTGTSLSDGDTFYRSEIRTTNSDIDTNNHVNNVRYINWALDSLPADFADGKNPERMRVQYKKELGAGCSALVVSAVSADGMTTHHTVLNGEDEYCSLEIRWQGASKK
jgi:acyl-ACP thioesterase